LDAARKYGIHMKALMSIGHAGETEETVDASREWLLKVQPEDFDVTIITVLPGSPYFDASVKVPHPTESHWVYTAKNGDKLYSVDIDYSKTMDYYKGVPGEYVSFVYTDDLSPKQLVALRDSLENEIRPKLGLMPLQLSSAKNYDHSMGAIPTHIMKSLAS
jgi:radical SAM superfamily enzyme YgiQ (UPF0313 family)